MAINRTRNVHYNQKVIPSISTVEHIPWEYFTADGGEGSILWVLPEHSIIWSVMVIEEEATDANAKFDMTVGGIPLVTNGQLDVNGLITPPQLANLHMEVGGDVIIKEGSTAPTLGEFTILLAYIEHFKHSGEYTNFSNNGIQP